ncbi:MAG: sugar transferase [Candidatus Andersenbacteria bacterium]|nr:sugar transferase [Candidatus Andersenbacteria bacterium]
MKRSELFFGAILLPIDFLMLLAAGAAAYYLRVSSYVQGLRPATFQFDLPLAEQMQLVAVVSVVIVAIFGILGLYAMQVTRRALDEFTKIFAGISIGIMLVVLYIFLSAELFQSRFIVLAAYGFAIVFVTFGRYVVRNVQRYLLRRGVGIHRVVLAGNGKFGDELTAVFASKPALGYRVVGVVPDIRRSVLEQIYNQQGMDEVVQTNPAISDEDNLVLLDFCEQYKIDYKYIPNLFETHAANVRFRTIGTVPIMELNRTPLDGWGRVVKRIMDLAGSIFGLVLLSPLLLLTAAAIRLNSPGPVFYRQVRMGRNMQPFEIIKFRSMFFEYCVGEGYGGRKAKAAYEKLREQANERKGPLFKMKGDPRITTVGRIIRKLRIDELPQLINVLYGEMSLLGPRPHLPQEVEQYSKHHRRLFTIKPGMSGMAQVAGNAGLAFEEEAKLDIAYIEQWSLRLDIILLLKTLRILVSDRNAI